MQMLRIGIPAVGVLVVAACVGGEGGELRSAPPSEAASGWEVADPVVRAVNRGVLLMERYEYSKAVEAFARAAELAPNSIEARVNLAIARYNRAGQGDLEEAEKLLDEVLGEHPDDAGALYFRGIIYLYTGRDAEAVLCFEKTVERYPHDAYAWYLLARSKSHLDRPCRVELERAVRENPALTSAYYDLMRVAVREGKGDEARRYQRQFSKLRENPLAETVDVVQYGRMGPLSMVRPAGTRPKRPVAGGELSVGLPRVLYDGGKAGSGDASKTMVHGAAFGDVNGDGRLDMVATAGDVPVVLRLFLGREHGTFTEATGKSGLADVRGAMACAFGDYDNDDQVDLFVSCAGPNYLFRGRGDGTFEDVTAKTGTAGGNDFTYSAVFLDADHDADLDIYVCHGGADKGMSPAANQLLNNNADGTFTDIATEAGVACAEDRSVTVVPADFDGDRDTDLLVFNDLAPARVFFNDRQGKYHEGRITEEPIRGDLGGVAQDFNGDGRADLMVLYRSAPPHLFLSDGTGLLRRVEQFDGVLRALDTRDVPTFGSVADMDLDGDLDILVCGRRNGHALLNDGYGRFVLKASLWTADSGRDESPVALVDLTGDGLPDLLRVVADGKETLELLPTVLEPAANWLAVVPTGTREKKATRSPSSGYGTRVELRCGLHGQVLTYTGLNGGLNQSHVPLVFGLNGASQADYLAITWPDGVTQAEGALAAGQQYRISETQRRQSSCPVLFAWNGERFEFIGDFAGVGGLGYFVAPGEYATPEALEQVKIEPRQLRPREGLYELRVGEPMEEVAYLDRLELVAVDHPARFSVYPDERLVITGPPATHRLLCPAEPIFPVRATGPNGEDCTARIEEVDRVYAYQPPLDRRFFGFCAPHSLVLDFGDRLGGLPADRRVYLFLNGWIEYPYSQTTYAARQAGVVWQPLRIERLAEDGDWEIVVPDAGSPGGMGRTMAIELTSKLPRGNCTLRISTNLEIYLDQVFVAADRGTDGLLRRTVPLKSATLRRLGFPQEYSPDGLHPLIYNYDIIEPISSLKMPGGSYTRYGPVESLLREFDDRYVVLGTGDEIAVAFDAEALPPVAEGWARSFILVSHAYCKDMDLYTAEPDTVEPLPFRGMSRYPYPQNERYPETGDHQRYRAEYNTRRVD